jgi:hypothetical protein
VGILLRDDQGEDIMIQSAGPGDFKAGIRFFFYASFDVPKDPFYRDAEFPGGYYLTLVISFDEFPEEIGTELSTPNGTRIFYRPPRYYYPDVITSVSEKISIPMAYAEYKFTFADIFGDGFGGLDGTGYSLWDGDEDTGNLLLTSSFSTGSSEVFRFTTCDLALGCSGSLARPDDYSTFAPTNVPTRSPSPAPTTLAPTFLPTVISTRAPPTKTINRNPNTTPFSSSSLTPTSHPAKPGLTAKNSSTTTAFAPAPTSATTATSSSSRSMSCLLPWATFILIIAGWSL